MEVEDEGTLAQQKCVEAIKREEKLSVELTATQKVEIVSREHNAFLLSLVDEILREVADETMTVGM